jgi:hypothetical protein
MRDKHKMQPLMIGLLTHKTPKIFLLASSFIFIKRKQYLIGREVTAKQEP